MKKIILLLIVSLFVSSCSSSIYKQFEFPKFLKKDFFLTTESDSMYVNINLFTIDDNEKLCYEFLKSIDSVLIDVKSDDFAQNFSFYKPNLKYFGTESDIKGNSIVLPINLKFQSPKIMLNNISLSIVIYSDLKSFRITKIIKLSNEPKPLRLFPLILDQNNEKLEIGVLAVRNKIIEEYIPSSEELRLEVVNYKGKKIFSSQAGVNFLQIILPVMPENIGNYYLYKQQWNYKTSDGNFISKGKYYLNLMIPALPNPYKVNLIMEK